MLLRRGITACVYYDESTLLIAVLESDINTLDKFDLVKSFSSTYETPTGIVVLHDRQGSSLAKVVNIWNKAYFSQRT